MSEHDTIADLESFRRSSRTLVDGVTDHLAALPSRPVWQPLPDALRARLLDLPLPERAATLDGLVATVLRDLLPHAIGNGHPPSSAGSTRRRARPPATTPTSTSSAWWSAG